MAWSMSTPPRIGLTLVLGPANSGKMGYILDWWRERSTAGPVLVTPTWPDARELMVEMARATGAVVGQSPAQTFDGLVRLVVGWSPEYASDLDLSLMLARLLGDVPLDALGGAADLPGTVTALATFFLELSESGRTPEDIDRILSLWASTDAGARPLAGDLRRLLRGYAGMCERVGLAGRPQTVREAVQAAQVWTRPVALYGFTSLTLGQRAIVDALSRRTEVVVTLNHDGSRSVDLSTPAEVSWLRSRAVEVVELSTRDPVCSSPAVAYLQQHFSGKESPADPPPRASGPEGVHLLVAAGRRAEAELAAERTAALIRGGLKPGDIAVIVRRMRTWSRLLAEVFDSCGINYELDDRRVLGETGLGYAFLSALKGAMSDDAEGVLAYLRSPYSGSSVDEVNDLETEYRRGTARGAAVLTSVARARGLACLEGVWEGIGCDAAAMTEPLGSPVTAFCPEAAEELARRMLMTGLHSSAMGSQDAAEDARAFRAIENALVRIRSFPDRFDAPLVLRTLARAPVQAGRTEVADAVHILSVHRARARRFKAVVVLGLVEGEFPGRQDTPSLLTPAQKARLDGLGRGLFAPETDEEAALFLSAVSRALQVVVLSSRDAEDDGSEAEPSRFWTEAKRLLGLSDLETRRRTLADQVFVADAAPSLRHYLRARAALGRLSATDDEGGSFTVRSWGRVPDRLTSPEILDELASVECYSPSSLEAYTGCPFSWFVEKVVGVEDTDLELDARLVGQLVHDALNAAYPRLASRGLLPVSPENLGDAERLAFRHVDGLMASTRCPGTPAERRLAAWRVKRMIRNLFDMEMAAAGTLILAETETWVGGSEGVDVGGLRVRGRIDRIDATPDGRQLFVLDYKSGAIPSSGTLGKEDGLQLPLYLMALRKERPGAQVIGGAYLSLPRRERSGVVSTESADVLGAGVKSLRRLDERGMEELFRVTRETAQEAVTGMRAGVIAPRPKGPCPPWCRLGPACRARREGYRP